MPKPIKLTFLKSWQADKNLPTSYQTIHFGSKVLYETNKQQPESSSQIHIVQDVPDYLTIQVNENKNVKLKTIQTLKGHILELETFNTLNDYLLKNFNTKNRNNLKRYVKKLETCFPITYKTYYGDINKQEYNALFVKLETMLINRFQQKQEANYELQHLDEFKKNTYQLVLEKKANIFVIYDDEMPISIRINIFNQNLSYYILSGYDINYSKFHLGSIDMLKNIEWCILNNYNVYDLLKGYNAYKSKWATRVHQYQMHIIYNPKNFNTNIIANLIAFKETCRYLLYNIYLKNNLDSYHKQIKKLKFQFSEKNTQTNNLKISIEKTIPEFENLKAINIRDNATFDFLKNAVFNFLYETNTPIKNLKVFIYNNTTNKFIIQGINNKIIMITTEIKNIN